MDIKIHGLTRPIVEEAIRRAHEARNFIMDTCMSKAIAAPRTELSKYAPKIVSMMIDPQKIGDVVGQRGKTINAIIERTGVKIDITDGYLTINAKVEKEDKEDNKNYVRRERFTGEVSRSFYVGDDIKEEEVKASFKNGILTLEVPKLSLEDKKKDKKYIEISE